jgi:two-component system, OmpR family, phosphate regulon sensor histidine kinase PhoR
MQSKTLRIFVALSVILMFLIAGTQYYWFKKAYSLEETDFDQRVTNSLRVVTKRMLNFNRNPNNTLLKPVERVSGNYYTVQINDKIDQFVLEEFLKQEMARHDVKQNFEYGIYDCMKNQIQYGGFVCATPNCDSTKSFNYEFPALKLTNYYFGVYFPDRKLNMLNEMGSWFFSTALLFIVFSFFAYALWVIFRQKRLSEIQNDFINNMTHEFKTPISTISISSEVLMNPNILEKPDRLLSYATIIRKEADRLKKNVDTVLQTANISQKIDNLNFELLNIKDLIDDQIATLEPTLKEKNAIIAVETSTENLSLNADKLHLTNVLNNLIDNSLKYCEKAPSLIIKINEINSYLEIILIDNGIGISEKDQENIFKKFFRVHTGDIHNVKGFGLGLYYVKEIIKGHFGQISVKSKLGSGTEFTILLPLKNKLSII